MHIFVINNITEIVRLRSAEKISGTVERFSATLNDDFKAKSHFHAVNISDSHD